MEKDEEKLLSRRRLEKWIKVFLAFLAFAWLCTIISKSIYVSGLTRVRTDTASKKYVEHIVETDGIVTTGGEIAVNTQSGLRVDRIYVRQGDVVKAGDLLFTIDLADISDMIRAKETELARQQYNLSDIQVNAMIDSQKKEIALLWAEEDYETADRETAVVKERAKEALDRAEAELEEHLADVVPYTSDSTRRDAWDAYHDWVNQGYGISDRITAKEREMQDLEEQLSELEKQGSIGTGTGNHGSDEKTLSGAAGSQAEQKRDITKPDEEKNTNTDNKKDTDTAGKDETKPVGEDDTESTDQGNTSVDNNSDIKTTDQDNVSVDSKKDTNPTDQDNMLPDNANNTNPTDQNNTSTDTDDTNPTDQDNTSTDTGDTNPTDQDNINTGDNTSDDQSAALSAEKRELQDRIKAIKEELLALQDELTRHDREVVTQPDYSVEELKYDEWQSTKLALEANVQSAKENYNDVSYAREVTLRQKQRDIASVQVTAMADSTVAIYELDIRQTQTQLASLYAIQEQKGEIRAQSDGVVSAIRIEVGGRTSDMAAILMTDVLRPCQFKFSITKEQGKYVHLNDTVELKLNGQSADMEVTVDYFAENAQGGYDAVCMLPEGVGQPGLNGSMRKTVQGEYHNLALPSDAVYEEQGGYYIFVLNEKEGILGSEYYVEKVKVQVKDQNERFTALESGTISADTKVIVYATRELKQGESVRPQDTQEL